MASMGYHVIYKKPVPSRSTTWILAALPQHARHSLRTQRNWPSSTNVESVHGLGRLRYSRHATRTRPTRLTPWSPCSSQALTRTEAQESTTRSAKQQQRELSVAPAVKGGRAFALLVDHVLDTLRAKGVSASRVIHARCYHVDRTFAKRGNHK